MLQLVDADDGWLFVARVPHVLSLLFAQGFVGVVVVQGPTRSSQ